MRIRGKRPDEGWNLKLSLAAVVVWLQCLCRQVCFVWLGLFAKKVEIFVMEKNKVTQC